MIKLNGVEIVPTIFPDGTSQVWKIPEEVFKCRPIQEQSIQWDFEREAEFIHLAQLCDLIVTKGGAIDRLYIPYFPYARQDKEVSNSTTFAKSTFMRLLGSLHGVVGVDTDDIHSDSFSGRVLSNNEPYSYIINTMSEIKPDLVCFPDIGAKDRYKHLPPFSTTNDRLLVPTCSMSKDRDPNTGYIKNMFLNELEVCIKGQSVLIIDDICDGGMTFKLCAEKLLQCGAKDVTLYTTHGIYSKGIQTLKDSGISRIFNRTGEVFNI